MNGRDLMKNEPYGVAVVSFWPGPTATERAKALVSELPGGDNILKNSETPKFSGLVIASLYADPKLMSKSGNVVIAAEAALEYGFAALTGSSRPAFGNKRALRVHSSRKAECVFIHGDDQRVQDAY
jgi:hypothetical protein